MASRIYHYAESANTSTTTSTSDTAKVTLTFTPDPNSEYVYIWSAQVSSGSTSQDVRVNLKTGSTIIAEGNIEDKDTTDWHPVSGLEHETFGATPSAVTLTLNWSRESTATAGIREARILALKLESGDIYTENTNDQTNTTTTFSTALTLNWTPASAGDYILMGSAEYRFSAAGEVITKIVHSSTDYGTTTARPQDTTNYMPGMHAVYLSNLSGAQTATMQWARSATATGTAYCRRAALLALRVDNFPSVFEASSRARQQSSGGGTAVTTGTITTSNVPYFILGVCVRDHNATGNSALTYLKQSSTDLILPTEQEGTVASNVIDLPAGMWAQSLVFTPAEGSTNFNIQFVTENISLTSTGISDSAIFAIQLEEQPPVITVQPEAAVTAEIGQSIVLSVTATNATSYQWQVSSDGSSWANVSTGSGGTTDTYTFTSTAAGILYYRCVVSNAFVSINSDTTTLTTLDYEARFGSIDILAAVIIPPEAQVSWVELEATKSVIDEKISIYIVD